MTASVKAAKRASSGGTQSPSAFHPYVEATVDPWNAGPIRLPDDFKAGTTALKLVDEFTVTTTADGYAFFGVHPGLNVSYMMCTPVAGVTTAALTNTQHQDYASYTASHAVARLVLMTVEIIYIGAEQTSAGRFCCIDSSLGTEMVSTGITTMFDDSVCVMPCASGMRCIQRPYQTPRMGATVAQTFQTDAFKLMYFGVAGAPNSTTIFDVRVTKWLEGTPMRNSIMRGLAAVEPGVPHALALAGNVGTDGTDSVANNPAAVKSQVSRARKAAELAWKLFAATSPILGVPPGAVSGVESIIGALSALRM